MTIVDVAYSAQNLVKVVILLIAILMDSFLNPRNEEIAQDDEGQRRLLYNAITCTTFSAQ